MAKTACLQKSKEQRRTWSSKSREEQCRLLDEASKAVQALTEFLRTEFYPASNTLTSAVTYCDLVAQRVLDESGRLPCIM